MTFSCYITFVYKIKNMLLFYHIKILYIFSKLNIPSLSLDLSSSFSSVSFQYIMSCQKLFYLNPYFNQTWKLLGGEANTIRRKLTNLLWKSKHFLFLYFFFVFCFIFILLCCCLQLQSFELDLLLSLLFYFGSRTSAVHVHHMNLEHS